MVCKKIGVPDPDTAGIGVSSPQCLECALIPIHHLLFWDTANLCRQDLGWLLGTSLDLTFAFHLGILPVQDRSLECRPSPW